MREISWKDLEIKVKLPRKIRDTDCLSGLDEFIGQERAIEALETGCAIKAKGYNIFVSGQTNTGRRTFIRKYLKEKVKNSSPSEDWLYVYNFDDPRTPNSVATKAGMGKLFKKELGNLVEVMINAIMEAFQSEDYQKKTSDLQSEQLEKKERLLKELMDEVKDKSFTVKLNQTGVATIPLSQGKPLSHEIYDALPEEYKEQINKHGEEVRELVNTYLLRVSKSDRDFGDKLKELNKYIAAFSIDGHLKSLKEKYQDNEDIVAFLGRLRADVMDNLGLFFMDQTDPMAYFAKRYYVNLFVDNSQIEGRPVVEEMQANYADLFGRLEYISRMGALETDHSMIRAGALHRSNGGYLILDAKNILREPYVWDTLKQILFDEQHAIENLEYKIGIFSTVSLKPESIPVRVKVILIGEPWIYDLLTKMDTDFKKLFKIKAEFDWEMELTGKSAENICNLVCTIVRENDLLPFDRAALSEVVRRSISLSGSRDMISTRFGEIKQLLIESSAAAEKKGATMVAGDDIKATWLSMEKRGAILRDKLDKALRDSQILIETTGKVVGEINGLTVLQTEDMTFGTPVKITAKVSPGNNGIIDIQREVEMSGKIHNKASMIIQGYLNSKYAVTGPLSLNGYVSFEQVYNMVEGDSASVAETIAILSSIAGVPLNQGIAVTGSMNQSGRLQSVGGIPYKIEGFYRVCKIKGLTGSQGVVIPEANFKNLIFDEELLQAIKDKKFHVWVANEIGEVIKITTGIDFGKETKTGDYEKDTFNYRVTEGIRKLNELSMEAEPERKKA